MIEEKHKHLLDALEACAMDGEKPDDALVAMAILLINPNPEVCAAIDAEWITKIFQHYIDVFQRGKIRSRQLQGYVDVVLATEDERLIAGLQQDWIDETREEKWPTMAQVREHLAALARK